MVNTRFRVRSRVRLRVSGGVRLALGRVGCKPPDRLEFEMDCYVSGERETIIAVMFLIIL